MEQDPEKTLLQGRSYQYFKNVPQATVVLRKRGKLRWLAEKSRSQAVPGANSKIISQVHNSERSEKIL